MSSSHLGVADALLATSAGATAGSAALATSLAVRSAAMALRLGLWLAPYLPPPCCASAPLASPERARRGRMRARAVRSQARAGNRRVATRRQRSHAAAAGPAAAGGGRALHDEALLVSQADLGGSSPPLALRCAAFAAAAFCSGVSHPPYATSVHSLLASML